MKIKNANLSSASTQQLLHKDSNPERCLQNICEAKTKATRLLKFYAPDPDNILDMS